MRGFRRLLSGSAAMRGGRGVGEAKVKGDELWSRSVGSGEERNSSIRSVSGTGSMFAFGVQGRFPRGKYGDRSPGG